MSKEEEKTSTRPTVSTLCQGRAARIKTRGSKRDLGNSKWLQNESGLAHKSNISCRNISYQPAPWTNTPRGWLKRVCHPICVEQYENFVSHWPGEKETSRKSEQRSQSIILVVDLEEERQTLENINNNRRLPTLVWGLITSVGAHSEAVVESVEKAKYRGSTWRWSCPASITVGCV